MADEKVELRDVNFRQLLPWTEIFRGFQVALDPKKLLLAAAGILVMWFGWWVISGIFFNSRKEPVESDYPLANFKTAGETESEAEANRRAVLRVEEYKYELLERTAGPGGRFNTRPWVEPRGPNPYLLVTGQTGQPTPEGHLQFAPWQHGHFWDWFRAAQLPVLLEPLVKFLRPVVYLLQPNAGFWNHVYFLLILLWTLATWALFGGAITRMAAVQLTRKEKISMSEAVKFALSRYFYYFSAPLLPLLFVVGIMVLVMLFGLLHLIPVVGDLLIDGLGWPLVLLAGVVMAVILVGLVGWPLMYATISTEGSDNLDALSRSFSYVFQYPWHYIWNCLVALAYGAVVVFFVGFMGSFMVYLGKWSITHTPLVEVTNREPTYLFIHAPQSYQWRNLLLQGSPLLHADGSINAAEYTQYRNSLHWWNLAAAYLVGGWLTLALLMVVGFGYSYFWCSFTIIYLLMRRLVDDTEMDEIYLEEDEAPDAYSSPMTSASTATAPEPTGTGAALTMVEAPTLRTPTSAPVTEVTAPATTTETPAPGDGAAPLP